jgi:hypothetical protein
MAYVFSRRNRRPHLIEKVCSVKSYTGRPASSYSIAASTAPVGSDEEKRVNLLFACPGLHPGHVTARDAGTLIYWSPS